MKRRTILAISLAAVLGACTSSPVTEEAGTSTGMVSLSLSTEGERFTRALNEADYRDISKYTVDILQGETVVKSYKGDALPKNEPLPFGTYSVHAYYGTASAASRTSFLSEGNSLFTLVSGGSTSVSVACAPTCGKAVVNFAENMATYFNEYYVEYKTKALGTGVAKWEKNDADPWYLLVDPAGETVTATIYLTPKEEYEVKDNTTGVTSTGTVVRTYKLYPNKSWTLNITPNYHQTSGELGIEITIDESTNDKEQDIVIPTEWIK
ncbi:MAG: DUF4493 domain-containing protein [Bacteroidaceae bacterium]|nr:DUF4493 domain-containing protein [Bacteroidaceae bacterium]